MISRLNDVLTWECQQHGINPQADSDFLLHDGSWHRDLRNLVGHRDVSSTTCPGGNVYALVPQIRSDVAARLGSTGPTVSITAAPSEGTVSEGEVEYAWTGSGGSGGLEYSYYLEGWSWQPATGAVDYIRGFTSRQSPAWSPWTRDTGAHFCFLAGGNYTFHVRARDSGGTVSVYQDSRTFLGTPQTMACDDTLLKGSGATVYVMQRGLRRPVPNPVTFWAQGYLWGNINVIADSSLASIPEGQPLLDALADGVLLKKDGEVTVYVMQGGLRRPIANGDVFLGCGYGWDAVSTISNSQLNAVPSGPDFSSTISCPKLLFADRILLHGSDVNVYAMQGGNKRWVLTASVFLACGYQWGNTNRIADSSLAGIPSGPGVTGPPCP